MAEEKNYFELFKIKGKAVNDNADPDFQKKMQEMLDFEKEELDYQTCEKLYNNIIIKKLLSEAIEKILKDIKTSDDFEKKNKVRLIFYKKYDYGSNGKKINYRIGYDIQVFCNGESVFLFENFKNHQWIYYQLIDYANEMFFATKNNISMYTEVLDRDETYKRNLEFECTLGELIYIYYMENKRYESETVVHEEYKKFQKKKYDY